MPFLMNNVIHLCNLICFRLAVSFTNYRILILNGISSLIEMVLHKIKIETPYRYCVTEKYFVIEQDITLQ